MLVVTSPMILGAGIGPFDRAGILSLDQARKPRVNEIRIMDNEVVWDLSPEESSRGVGIMSAVDCRALYFTAPGKIEIREEPPPSPGEGELILQSCLQGISPGTERLMFTGNFPRGMQSDPAIDGFSGSFDYPFRYGYINVAVDDTGRRFFAFRDHVTRFTARPEELIPLPDSMDNETALLIPHTETALSIVHDLNPHLGDRVLVSGAGIVGTLTAELLDRYQGCKVSVVDPLPDKASFFDTERIAFFTNTGEGTRIWKL